jgi:hypothetical protein
MRLSSDPISHTRRIAMPILSMQHTLNLILLKYSRSVFQHTSKQSRSFIDLLPLNPQFARNRIGGRALQQLKI